MALSILLIAAFVVVLLLLAIAGLFWDFVVWTAMKVACWLGVSGACAFMAG